MPDSVPASPLQACQNIKDRSNKMLRSFLRMEGCEKASSTFEKISGLLYLNHFIAHF